MSTRPTTLTSATCSYCDGERDPDASIRGSYCSRDCYHREKGENALGELRREHSICSACFRKRVEVEYPSDTWIRKHGEPPDAFVGFKYPLPHLRKEGGLVYCGCGTVEHYSDNEFVRPWELREVALNLHARLQELYEEHAIAHDPDGVELMRALRESECDWALAVGRAIYSGE